METKYKVGVGAGFVGLTGVILAANVPVATVEDKHTFEECDGATTHLVYRAFLLGKDSIDVTVRHPAFPEDARVSLRKIGDQYDIPVGDNPWLRRLLKNEGAQNSWKDAAIGIYNKLRNGSLKDAADSATRTLKQTDACYVGINERISDIAKNPGKYLR